MEHLQKREDGHSSDESWNERVDVRNGGVGEDGSDVEDENGGGNELASVRATVLPVIIVSFSPRLDDSVLDFFFIVFDDDFCIVLEILISLRNTNGCYNVKNVRKMIDFDNSRAKIARRGIRGDIPEQSRGLRDSIEC